MSVNRPYDPSNTNTGGGMSIGGAVTGGSPNRGIFLNGASALAQTSYTFIYPLVQGANGDTLVNDGAGNLTWQPNTAAPTWILGGNAGLVDGTTNQLGTTDAQNVRFITAGTSKLIIRDDLAGDLQFFNASNIVDSAGIVALGIQARTAVDATAVISADFQNRQLRDGSNNFSLDYQAHILYSPLNETASIWSFSNITNAFAVFAGTTTNPNTVITGSRGDIISIDDGATGALWVKQTGVGNTGWVNLATSVVQYYAEPAVAPATAPVSSAANAIAIGNSATAGAASAYALGNNADATGTDSFVFGTNATDGGFSDSIIFGNGAAALTGIRNIIIGAGADATGAQGIAIGFNASVTNSQGIAIGDTTVAASDAVALGNSADATGVSAYALGESAQASALRAVAIGRAANSSAARAVALGAGAVATQIDSIILGDSTVNAVGVGIGTNTPSTKLHVSTGGQANTVAIVTLQNGDGNAQNFIGNGSPEGVVTGSRGDVYRQLDSVGDIYKKTTDATNTGWEKLISASSANSAFFATTGTAFVVAFGNTTYIGLNGSQSSVTETDVQTAVFAGDFNSAILLVSSNTLDTATTYTLRVNGAPTGMTITVGAGVTGTFPSVGTATVATGDAVAWEQDSSTATVGSITSIAITSQFLPS